VCGRYTHRFTWRELHGLMDLRWPTTLELAPSWNVAPTQEAPIVREAERGGVRGREVVMARWGLVPSWARDESIGGRMINARSDTAPEKPAFRSAMKRRRCVVPVSGFYEWERSGPGPKRPWYIRRADDRVMLLAGLWESWTGGPDGPARPALDTFTILTTEANRALEAIHDRMPVVLEPERVALWLDPGTPPDSLAGVLVPAPDGVLTMRRVGVGVNSPRRNDASLIEPIADEPREGLFGAA
jgi:putative SOS response-associated peptidase YedK